MFSKKQKFGASHYFASAKSNHVATKTIYYYSRDEVGNQLLISWC